MNLFLKRKTELKPHLMAPLYLPYKGGELLGFFLDNFTNHAELIKETILKNEQSCHRPSMPFLVVYDVTATEITAEIAEFLIDSIGRMSKNIKKLAFVGATRQGKKQIQNCLAKQSHVINTAVNYFSGHEPAKEWLIPR